MCTYCGEMIPMERFRGCTNMDVFITAYCYEDRVVESTKRIIEQFKIGRVYIFKYNVDDYLEADAVKSWQKNKAEMERILKLAGITLKEINCKHDDIMELYRLNKIIHVKEKVLIDITGFTKNYILGLVRLLDRPGTLFFYTRGEYRAPTPQELNISIRKIEILPGFEGFTRLDRKDLVVLILGYEGHRALAFLNKFDVEPVYAIMGIPFESEERNRQYINNIRKANNALLNVHRVFLSKEYTHSLEPFLFAEDLERIIKTFPLIEQYNVCISCLGTKLQTLGLYLYWKRNQCQIWYSVPNKRFNIIQGVGQSWVIRLN